MAAYVHFFSLFALLHLLSSHLAQASSTSASIALAVPPETHKKTLIKRPVVRTEPTCDGDYGVPDYLACLIAVSWIPPDESDANNERLFGSPEAPSSTSTIQLPITMEAGDCFIRVEMIQGAGRRNTDYAKWRDIKAAAAEVSHRCVGARRSGGTFVAGESYGISVTVYSESSDFRNALAALAQLQASIVGEESCESAGSNEACSTPEARPSHWSIPAYRPTSSGSSCPSSRISTECILKIVQRTDLMFGLRMDRLIGALIPQLTSDNSISRKMVKRRHALVKRLDPPHCDENYGFPNLSACSAAFSQLPSGTDTRVFVRNMPTGTQVKVPFSKIGYTVASSRPCIITVNLERSLAELYSYSRIKSMAADILDTCLGHPGAELNSFPGSRISSRGWGGYQLGGLDDRISVTVYTLDSPWNKVPDEKSECEATPVSPTESDLAADNWCAGVLRDEPLLENCGAGYCTSGKSCCGGYACMPLRPDKVYLLLGLIGGIGSCSLSSS